MTNANPLSDLSDRLADAVARAAAALVVVKGRERLPATGIVIGSDLVLTADHVLERDDDLSIVTADGRALAATLLGRDPSTDLALLRVAELDGQAIRTATPRVGALALAVGRPGSDGPQASLGVIGAVSGPLRTPQGSVERVLRVDATPYPGFSGGALIDSTGAAYALFTTGLALGTPLGVPMDLALAIADQLRQHGAPRRGYLGIVSQPARLTAAHATLAGQDRGLLIAKVEDGSPAEKAGLLMGDTLLALGDVVTRDADALMVALRGDRVGKTVAARVLRAGAIANVNVEIGQRP